MQDREVLLTVRLPVFLYQKPCPSWTCRARFGLLACRCKSPGQGLLARLRLSASPSDLDCVWYCCLHEVSV